MTDAAKALLDKVLSIASTELGYKENPPNSNMTKYGKWYGLNGNPWCMMFIMWLFNQAEILADLAGNMIALPKRTASCSALMSAAKAKGQFVTNPKKFQSGDVLIYTFGHTGILESVKADGTLIAIEGNTGLGNDANGGEVMCRSRTVKQCRGAVRPDWERAAKALTKDSVYLIAQQILDGKWGNGDLRKKRLREAGYDPSEMQAMANALSKGTLCVCVTADILNVRRGPGTNYDIADKFYSGCQGSIRQVQEGKGSTAGWGKTFFGWISLDYVRRLL